MDETLTYLKKYLTEPRLFPTLPPGDPDLSGVPDWWRGALTATGGDRIRLTLQAWEEFRPQLPAVVAHLGSHLRDVKLLTDSNLVTGTTSVRLLYELGRDNRTLYYVGGNPLQKSMTGAVKMAWDRLPAEFKRFYDTLHNGWYYLASQSMGPSPTEDFFILDDNEWGILDEIGDPGCDLKDLLAVYSNGMGDYVALSVEQKASGDVLWWKAKPPRLKIDAWAVMDAWTELGFET